jgi:hypothetical protein
MDLTLEKGGDLVQILWPFHGEKDGKMMQKLLKSLVSGLFS